MRKITFLVTMSIFVLNLSIWAITGSEVLKRVEEKMIGEKAPKDMEAIMSIMRMIIVSPKGSKKVRELKAWTKNNINEDDWRVMKCIFIYLSFDA